MHGGKRVGAGRKVGAVNKASSEARQHAQSTGELPHEFLLRVARGESIDEHVPEFRDRVDAAKAAAPYFAPRLAATAVELTQKSKTAQEMTDDELEAIIASYEERRETETPI